MTNKEKAEKLSKEYVIIPHPITPNDIVEIRKTYALKMDEWKDQQFKKYLEKKLGKYAGGELVYAGVFINDIINELFEEE